MEKITLQARARGNGRHALRELRGEALVPAVVYGQGVESFGITVEEKALHRALRLSGASLILLDIEGRGEVNVLAREVQRHPTRHRALHVDFQAVAMNEKLRVNVPIHVEGTAPALNIAGVVMVRNLDALEIECLPDDIPGHIVADASLLESADDTIRVRDLKVPAGVDILSDPETVVISLTIEAEEVEEPAEGAEGAAEVEVVAKGKAKGEESEEE